MRLIFMGTPAVAVPCLEALLQAGHQVVGVYCPPDRPTGRHGRPEPPPVKVSALSLGLPVFQPASLRRPRVFEILAGLKPEAIVVAAYGKFLPENALALPPLGCLNLHPSLLPRHRGPAPVMTALLEGDAVSGVSILLLDQGMDTGPILAQQEEPILSHDTTASLTERLFRRGAELLIATLARWAAGAITPRPQDEGQATVTHLVRKEDGWVSWDRSALSISRMVRAYSPWPGASTRWQGQGLKLLEVEPHADVVPQGETGTAQAWGVDGVAVATGEGLLELRRLQLEGKRPLPTTEFLRGARGFVGARLPS